MKLARNIINQNQADKPETIQVVNKGRSKDKTPGVDKYQNTQQVGCVQWKSQSPANPSKFKQEGEGKGRRSATEGRRVQNLLDYFAEWEAQKITDSQNSEDHLNILKSWCSCQGPAQSFFVRDWQHHHLTSHFRKNINWGGAGGISYNKWKESKHGATMEIEIKWT